MKGVCLLIAGILFLLLFFSFSGIEKTKLLDTDGRNFEKAEVTNVISGNLSNSGSGKQTVELKLLSGDHKGKIIQATSSQSYLFGAKCKKGMKVIAIINESKGELLASVYSVNRGPMVWLMAAVFVAIVVAVGGRKGISSILSLVFTMLCIFFIFLPMIYKGISPILAAVLVVGSQGLGKPSHQWQVFLGTNAATHHDQALGIGDLWPLMEKEEPNIVANLGNYYPSMAQDAVLHQRQTEISVLNGAIARYGERLGVPTPFNTVITKVISCIQNNYDKQYLG